MTKRHTRPPLLYAVRERLKYPIVRAGWGIGLDWPHRFVPSSLTGLVLVLKQLGWTPTTCIDVGVAWGTVELQRGFASSRHILVEPSPAVADFLAAKARRNGWSLFQVAASDHEGGTVPFFLHPSFQGSRITSDERSDNGDVILVPTTTLDALDAATGFGDNILLKIDVEGHEGATLAGATRLLERVQVAVIETSPGGATSSSQIVSMLLRHDLHLVGFLTPWVEGRERRRLQMVDLVFARPGSVLLRQAPGY